MTELVEAIQFSRLSDVGGAAGFGHNKLSRAFVVHITNIATRFKKDMCLVPEANSKLVQMVICFFLEHVSGTTNPLSLPTAAVRSPHLPPSFAF